MGSIFDLFSGGWGFANGGKAQPFAVNRVNERGFEMASVGGKDYLMAGSSLGEITTHHKLRGGSGVTTIDNSGLAAPTSQRTREQVASRICFEQDQARGATGERLVPSRHEHKAFTGSSQHSEDIGCGLIAVATL